MFNETLEDLLACLDLLESFLDVPEIKSYVASTRRQVAVAILHKYGRHGFCGPTCAKENAR